MKRGNASFQSRKPAFLSPRCLSTHPACSPSLWLLDVEVLSLAPGGLESGLRHLPVPRATPIVEGQVARAQQWPSCPLSRTQQG